MAVEVEFEWPNLPTFGDEHAPLEIPSLTERGKKYLVDLCNYTCTCPDFVTKRGAYPRYDLRRACKHIRSLVERKHPLHFQRRLTFNFGDQEVRAVQMFDHNWIDVYTSKRSGSRSRKFGYSLAEHRWSYGDAPKNAVEIACTLSKCLRPFGTSQDAQNSDSPIINNRSNFERLRRWIGAKLATWLGRAV